jgi:tRNA A-37 threonylcarbamoyl transferase component Bud32
MDSATVSPSIAGDRSEIGGYAVVRTLVPDQSWLADAPGGRRVVLKVLDDDCLWKGQLHPNIKDRLGRVRELAHVGVANLYGVERDDGLTYLVWEYVAGRTLDEYAASPACGQRDLLVVARDLVLGVEMLHARGIVHGTIKGSNAVVTPTGRLVITHVSPLLYSEPGEDVTALLTVLNELVERRGEQDSPLARLLAQAGEEETTLRRLAARMGALLDAREAEPALAEEDRAAGRRVRRRALIGAVSAALLGVALFVGLKQYANSQTPQRPVPPQASPAALQPAPGESASAAATPSGWSSSSSRRVTR